MVFSTSNQSVLRAEAKFFVANVYKLYESIGPCVRHTPLLSSSLGNGHGDLLLKCENLQHTGSFKYRSALAALFCYQHYHPKIWDLILKEGIITYSTGNFAKALAYVAHQKNLKLTVLVHESVELKKIASIMAYHPETAVVKLSLEMWKSIVISGCYKGSRGFFIASAMDPYVTLGNATLGVEILKESPNIDSIIIPHGSGNLVYGLSRFLKYFKPNICIHTVEVKSRSPFFESFKVNRPITVPHKNTFVDGLSAAFLIPEQFYRIKPFIEEPLVVSSGQIARTIVKLALHEKLVTEGAGAAAVAAGIYSRVRKPVCCIISGGNTDPTSFVKLVKRYAGQTSEGASK